MRAWRWWGRPEVVYSRLARRAPARSSEARGDHFLLALGLGLALGQNLSSPSWMACSSACRGALLCCHLVSQIYWRSSSWLSFFSAYRLLGGLGSVSILNWMSIGIWSWPIAQSSLGLQCTMALVISFVTNVKSITLSCLPLFYVGNPIRVRRFSSRRLVSIRR